jgi:hypothetical protein
VLAALGLALPNAPALALTRHGEAAGTAAALLGAVQFGVGALAAPLVGALGSDSVAMAVVVAIGMLGSLSVLLLVVRPSRLAQPVAAQPASSGTGSDGYEPALPEEAGTVLAVGHGRRSWSRPPPSPRSPSPTRTTAGHTPPSPHWTPASTT